MERDLHCSYSVVHRDIVCRHKRADIQLTPNVVLHNHDGYEFFMFLEGEVNFFVESDAHPLQRGDLVLIPPYVFHGIHMQNMNNYERICLNVRQGMMDKLGDNTMNLGDCCDTIHKDYLHLIHLEGAQFEEMMSIMDHLCEVAEVDEPDCQLLAHAYLTEFLVKVNRLVHATEPAQRDSAMPPLLKDVFALIEENLSSDLTVERIAQELHLNRDYISRVFKTHTGGSLKAYINARKISLAQQYLHQGYSPYDVCFMVGYNNYSSFSRCFEQQIQYTPKKYQLLYQSGGLT